MLQRGMIFLLFLILAVLTYFQGRELLLGFFIFLPLLLFPLMLFLEQNERPLLRVAAFLFLFLFGTFFFHYPSYEMFALSLVLLATIFIYFFYLRRWRLALTLVIQQDELLSKELTALEQKHTGRLESLHHLEKQVSSLMNLFEIARDFSECLSFEALAELLYKKLMPELPFKRMRLLSLHPSREEGDTAHFFTITAEGIEKDNPPLTAAEFTELEEVRHSKKAKKEGEVWIFPILEEGESREILMVEGADPDDITKFEVLVSHLVLQAKKIRLYEAVKELSIIDGLTGVFVRRHFLERFDEELKRCIKYGLQLAVLMLDIDHFKRYNDDFGHLVGDATLREVAALLKLNLRKVDIVGRYGGEEFVMTLPETRKEGAEEVAERIRSNIARHSFKIYDEETRVTVSVGIALFPDHAPQVRRLEFHPDLKQELIERSDKALYKAKEEGRNRVVLFQEP